MQHDGCICNTWLGSLDVGGNLPDKWVSGDQFAISAHIRADRSECFSVTASAESTAPRWDTLDPFIPASIVSHNEVLLFSASVEIEKHQRYRSRSTPDEFIHPHSPPSSICCFSVLFPLLLHLRPQNPFSCPSLLGILISLNKCITFIQVFLPLFSPLPSQELIDTWTQQAVRNQSPAATDKTACAS